MKEKIRNQQGFTLIEIIISIALIGIIAVALYAGIRFARQTLFASKDYMQNNYEIQADLEEYLGTKIPDVDSPLPAAEDLSISWASTTDVPDFKVSGFRMDKESSAFHLDETFKVYVSSAINPAQ
jgi:prepilin-type N-terminal cleavage/methylation domain-containing protein